MREFTKEINRQCRDLKYYFAYTSRAASSFRGSLYILQQMRAQEEAAGTCVADRLNQINLGVNIFLHAYTRRTEMVQTRLRAFAFCAYMNNNRAPLRHAMHPPADRKTTSTHQQQPVVIQYAKLQNAKRQLKAFTLTTPTIQLQWTSYKEL